MRLCQSTMCSCRRRATEPVCLQFRAASIHVKCEECGHIKLSHDLLDRAENDMEHGCHPLLGQHVEVVDVKDWRFLGCVGRTGVIHHDETFGHDYLSFDDGGSADPFSEVVVETVVSLTSAWREEVRAKSVDAHFEQRKTETQ